MTNDELKEKMLNDPDPEIRQSNRVFFDKKIPDGDEDFRNYQDEREAAFEVSRGL
jgi:hypothetical protein